MNGWFFTAALFSTLNFLLHLIMGGRKIASPLLVADSVSAEIRYVHYFCWHISTISLALLVILFALASFDMGGIYIPFVATALCAAIGLLGIIIPLINPVSFREVPQGWLFVPVTVFGLIGLM